MAKLIRADKTLPIETVVRDGPKWDIKFFERVLGGSIKFVRIERRTGVHVFVTRDQGEVVGLPWNVLASLMAREMVFGDCIHLTPRDNDR